MAKITTTTPAPIPAYMAVWLLPPEDPELFELLLPLLMVELLGPVRPGLAMHNMTHRVCEFEN